ncbi:MAG: CsgG/HfaB family protein [Thermoguttaceae bacterium]|jgi:tetratricopeptide (TPR) repeat protein
MTRLLAHSWLGIATLTVALASGCAQTAKFQVWQPAEFDVAGIRRLAVLEFRGQDNAGQRARSELVARLWDSGFYALADPTELNAIVQTSGYQVEGKPDLGAAIAAGRQLGVDAILIGEVIHYRADDRERLNRIVHTTRPGPGERYDRHGDGAPVGVGIHHDLMLQREVSVAMSLQLVDVRTGEIRAQRQASYRADGEIHNGQGYLPSKEVASNELITKWAREMSELLTPHLIPYEVELASPRWGSVAAEIRRGNNLALKGQWEKAAVIWEAALIADPKNHVAMYNLALAHAARFDYPRALELLEDASRLHPNTTYPETLSRIQRHEQAYLMAMSQKRQGGPERHAEHERQSELEGQSEPGRVGPDWGGTPRF